MHWYSWAAWQSVILIANDWYIFGNNYTFCRFFCSISVFIYFTNITQTFFFWQLPSIQTNMAVYEQVDAVKHLVFYWHFILYSKNKLSIISLNEKKNPKNKMSLLQREDISLIKNSNFPALYKSYKVSFFPGNFRDNHYTVQLLYLFHHKSS